MLLNKFWFLPIAVEKEEVKKSVVFKYLIEVLPTYMNLTILDISHK